MNSQKPSHLPQKENVEIENIQDFESPIRSLKRSMYSFQDVLNGSDLEALRDRFERCDELAAYESFCDKMCPYDFAWAMHDTRSNFRHKIFIVINSDRN